MSTGTLLVSTAALTTGDAEEFLAEAQTVPRKTTSRNKLGLSLGRPVRETLKGLYFGAETKVSLEWGGCLSNLNIE